MSNLSALAAYKALSLTEEEAFALLEMCTLTLAAESPSHLRVLSELSHLCREWLTQTSANDEEDRSIPFVSAPPFLDANNSKDEVVTVADTTRLPIPGIFEVDSCRVSWISFARSG